ncbi:hypothetical protein HNQ60_003010 [Povalibacter uvarum]|uniref:CENP-V/GFA domain-containing protein n=1 Tax=Povalibacter uvarum TaxID=732238 RepID=A0A841HP65_9GAMM|nr:GFA family protein [Povalibacter uvarum]MBB6094129.1 hypothetical protein [Povalibacter uvarum]
MSAVEGGCLCGAVRYRVSGTPISSSLCHCRSCRLASGAPVVAWFVVLNEQFALLGGELRAFRSSESVVREFCARCGSQISYQHDDAPDRIELTTVTLDHPEVFPPTREIWFSHKLSWVVPSPTIAHHAGESQET